jgi:hypothetical protein
VNYSLPAFAGELSFGLAATIVQEFKFTETTLDGYVLNPGDDRLGNLNYSTIAFAQPETRANFHVNYAFGNHNARFVTNYTSGVDDERYLATGLTPLGLEPGTTDTFGPTFYGVKGDDWLAYNLHYHGDFPFGTVSFSIVNITDEDPPAALEELGYDPRMGDPLGRTYEIGWRKQF